jgi:peptidoglycan/xylan/chitin deacetylase (PgdA/CDA1 family)
LTADDGWASIMNVIPWLAEQNIPITLFINPLYLDGIHKQEREAEKLLTKEELQEILRSYPNVSIASHGWSHVDTLKISIEEFEDSMQKSEEVLSAFPRKEPFYAFTYGHYKPEYIRILNHANLIPVLINGNKNYRYEGVIDREELV